MAKGYLLKTSQENSQIQALQVQISTQPKTRLNLSYSHQNSPKYEANQSTKQRTNKEKFCPALALSKYGFGHLYITSKSSTSY